MMESDHSETEETNLVESELNVEATRKRLRVEDSDNEEQELPTKMHRNSISKQSEILNKSNDKVIPNKNTVDNYDVKEENQEIHVESDEQSDEKDLSELDIDTKNMQKKENKILKQKDGNECALNKNNVATDKDAAEMQIKKEESKDGSPIRESLVKTNATSKDRKMKNDHSLIKEEQVDQTSDKESTEELEKEHISNSQCIDTEVVDGLELSVECASDKEELSSENEDEKNAKPRLKTVIIKVKPEKSELECSSSEEEKLNLQETDTTDTLESKSGKKNVKKKSLRTNSSKIKRSESEDGHNNNSDEDYNPRSKKKFKRSPTMKKGMKHSSESRKGRNEDAKNSSFEKTAGYTDDEDANVTLTEKTAKHKAESEEDLSEKESSGSKSESKDSEDENSMKNKREQHNSNRSKDDKRIQTLKRYLSVAGIKVRSYNDIWADCKSNTAKIKRLKELLEKNGVNGKPSLEKCKRVKEKNEKMREISELDVSNIISEGRITRARRNINNDKNAALPTTQHREARNTFKRIKTVIDSDSE